MTGIEPVLQGNPYLRATTTLQVYKTPWDHGESNPDDEIKSLVCYHYIMDPLDHTRNRTWTTNEKWFVCSHYTTGLGKIKNVNTGNRTQVSRLRASYATNCTIMTFQCPLLESNQASPLCENGVLPLDQGDKGTTSILGIEPRAQR